MTSQLEQFCKEHGIVTRDKKPWYMTAKRFEEARLEEAALIQEAFSLTAKMHNRYNGYLNVVKRLSSDLGEKSSMLTVFELPKIDYSDLEEATRDLRHTCSRLCIGRSGGAYEKLFYQKDLILEDMRHDTLRKAIHSVPKDKRVLVIRTGYLPIKHRRDKFDSEVEELASNPSNRLISIKMGDFYEWLGFAPSCMNYDDLYEIVDKWHADPRRIEISYI